MATAHIVTVVEARAAKPVALERFGSLATVVGVGITRIGKGYGLKVNLQTEPVSGLRLPTEVDGVPMHIQVIGLPRKQ